MSVAATASTSPQETAKANCGSSSTPSSWNTADPGWTRRRGDYTVSAARSSRDIVESETILLEANFLPPEWRPGG